MNFTFLNEFKTSTNAKINSNTSGEIMFHHDVSDNEKIDFKISKINFVLQKS
jgi:hypothetical protein